MFISGDKMVIYAGGDDGANNSDLDAGAVYTYTWDGTTWGNEQVIRPSGLEAGDNFGWSASISGDKMAVSARNDDGVDNLIPGSGLVYTYTWDGTTWGNEQVIRPSGLDASDRFGSSVSISGDKMVVGVNGDDGATNSVLGSGAVYTYTWDGTTWGNEQVIRPPGLDANEGFGRSVSMSGDKMAVGAWRDDGANNDITESGAVYTYTWNGTIWENEQVIRPSGLDASDLFGGSVSVSGDKMVVGADGDDGASNELENSGAVYTYVWDGTTWGNEQVIRPSGLDASDGFGASVSISGDRMVVGASGDDGVGNSVPDCGAVYVYTWDGTTWGNEQVLRASGLDVSDGFGVSVSISGDKIAVGANGDDGAGNLVTDSGAVYAFKFGSLPQENFVGKFGSVEKKYALSKPNSSGKNVRFADDEIKSSVTYGLKQHPPHEPISEDNPLFNLLPRTHTQTGKKYGYAKGKKCSGKRTDFYIDFVLPECETYCDNGCTAFTYSDRNGNCSIFEKCTELEDDEHSVSFIRVK